MKLTGAQAWRRSDSHSGGQKMKVRRCVVSGCSGCVVMGLIDRRRRSRNGDVHLGKGGVVAFEMGSSSVVQPSGCFRFGLRVYV